MLKVFVFIIIGIAIFKSIMKESFAPVGIEVWQSSRTNRPTRNMSYDIRGQPLSAPFINIGPWNQSTLPVSVAQFPRNTFLTKQQFETNSIGLTENSSHTITKGYLKGWPASSPIPTSGWINPALLNNEKRWKFYQLN